MTKKEMLAYLMAYWNQKVKVANNDHFYQISKIDFKNQSIILFSENSVDFNYILKYVEKIILPLRSVEDMTDEEITIAARKQGVIDDECPEMDIKHWISYFKKTYLDRKAEVRLSVSDYLRSIGIATTVGTCTLDRAIETGFVKIVKQKL